jgi:dihydrofolate reductase
MVMFVRMIMATSINGLITKGDDPNPAHWTSKEDQRHLISVIKSCDVMVIGRNTYEAGPSFFGNLPVKVAVMSHDTSPEIAKRLPRNVRFFNGKPDKILKHFEGLDVKRVLIGGGGSVNSDFMKAGLVDELTLTIEPKIFGSGKPIFAASDFAIDMTLTNIRWLNANGSIILTYRKSPVKK